MVLFRSRAKNGSTLQYKGSLASDESLRLTCCLPGDYGKSLHVTLINLVVYPKFIETSCLSVPSFVKVAGYTSQNGRHRQQAFTSRFTSGSPGQGFVTVGASRLAKRQLLLQGAGIDRLATVAIAVLSQMGRPARLALELQEAILSEGAIAYLPGVSMRTIETARGA